jgi:ApbE superfamily uncharacterized protein (UPF0280 family)
VTPAAAGSARVAATTAGMSTATGMSTAATMPSATAAMATTAATFISCIGRGRQRSGKDKGDKPKLESRHDVPQSLWTYGT